MLLGWSGARPGFSRLSASSKAVPASSHPPRLTRLPGMEENLGCGPDNPDPDFGQRKSCFIETPLGLNLKRGNKYLGFVTRAPPSQTVQLVTLFITFPQSKPFLPCCSQHKVRRLGVCISCSGWRSPASPLHPRAPSSPTPGRLLACIVWLSFSTRRLARTPDRTEASSKNALINI